MLTTTLLKYITIIFSKLCKMKYIVLTWMLLSVWFLLSFYLHICYLCYTAMIVGMELNLHLAWHGENMNLFDKKKIMQEWIYNSSWNEHQFVRSGHLLPFAWKQISVTFIISTLFCDHLNICTSGQSQCQLFT